jgi:hypothetical protein
MGEKLAHSLEGTGMAEASQRRSEAREVEK